MRWELATDTELWTIIAHDWDIPTYLIEGVVTEGLNRKLFDPLIKHLINKMFQRWDNERRYNFYDLYSIGYIGIMVALKNYQVGRASFKTFAYMNIKSEFNHHLDKINSEKRKVYENICSLDVKKFDDSEDQFLDSLVDGTENPEKAVIQKMFWEEQFSKLSEREKEVLQLFSQGFSFSEIGRMKGLYGAALIQKQFHRAVKKINPNAGKVNLMALGLTTRTKGA